MTAEYLTVTEIPGNKATLEQIRRLSHRYHLAAALSRDKDVLEIACGAGMGLGYLARTARRVVGGDIDRRVLAFAEERYRGRRNIELAKFDAQELPFAGRSFDVVLLFEAIYYLPRPEKFITEAKRVLRPEGTLVICSVNKDWPDFNPSPLSTAYFSAAELERLLRPHFREIEAYGAFLARVETSGDKIASFLKRAAVKLGLMPKTMKGKEVFKRIFFGRLVPLPPEIEDGTADDTPPQPIAVDAAIPHYKVFYLVARL